MLSYVVYVYQGYNFAGRNDIYRLQDYQSRNSTTAKYLAYMITGYTRKQFSATDNQIID